MNKFVAMELTDEEAAYLTELLNDSFVKEDSVVSLVNNSIYVKLMNGIKISEEAKASFGKI